MTMVSLKNQYAISPNIPRFAITLAAATAIGVGSESGDVGRDGVLIFE